MKTKALARQARTSFLRNLWAIENDYDPFFVLFGTFLCTCKFHIKAINYKHLESQSSDRPNRMV